MVHKGMNLNHTYIYRLVLVHMNGQICICRKYMQFRCHFMGSKPKHICNLSFAWKWAKKTFNYTYMWFTYTTTFQFVLFFGQIFAKHTLTPLYLLLIFRHNRLFNTRLQIEMTFVFILRGPFNREISRVAKRSPYC